MALKCFVLSNEKDHEARVAAAQAFLREQFGNDALTVEEGHKGRLVLNGLGLEKVPYVSIAPAGEKMLVAVKESPVGLDGECLKAHEGKRVDYGMLAERFFSGEEAEYVRDGDTTTDEKDRFFKIWTRKKAYIKYLGKTVADFPNFSVVEGDKLLSKVGSVTLRKFSMNFEGSEDYLFAIAGV